MRQVHKEFSTKGNCPSIKSLCGFTLAVVPTWLACCSTAVTLSVLVEGSLKVPIGKVLIEIGILWLVTIIAWRRASRWLSQDFWFRESRKTSGFGLTTFIFAAPLFQFVHASSRAMASGVPLKFSIDAAMFTAPFNGTMYFCAILLAASWSAFLLCNLRKIPDDSGGL